MKLLVVDDHDIVREGVKRLLALIPGAVVLEAASADDGYAMFEKERPEVVVLDINLNNGSGLDLLHRLRVRDSSARVVMFSMHSDPAYAARALKSGATGYVSKSAGADELVEAVKLARAGRTYVDRRLAKEMATSIMDGDPLTSLTARETDILRLLGEGKSLSEIGSNLGIAYKTVANTCTRVKEKLGVERTADLIRIAIERRTGL
jgi:two-component system, NarL family, invasion response regulator UvrY